MINQSILKIVATVMVVLIFNSCKNGNANIQQSFFGKTFGINAETSAGLNSAAYKEWIEDPQNGYVIQKKVSDFTFSAIHKPLEYLALQELKNQDVINQKQVKEKIEAYSGLQYFTFRIAAEAQSNELLKVNLSSEDEYYKRIEYFSFKMQDDLKLIDGEDTLSCSLFHFERVFGLAPYATFLLGFPQITNETTNHKKKNSRSKTLLYDDRMFGVGKIYMTFKEENLNQVPELIIN